jgi:hypothetical protein
LNFVVKTVPDLIHIGKCASFDAMFSKMAPFFVGFRYGRLELSVELLFWPLPIVIFVARSAEIKLLLFGDDVLGEAGQTRGSAK